MLTQHGAVDEATDGAQEAIGGDVILEQKPIKLASLHHGTLAHHDPTLPLGTPHRGFTVRRRS